MIKEQAWDSAKMDLSPMSGALFDHVDFECVRRLPFSDQAA